MKHKFFPGAVIKDDTLGDRQIRVVVSTAAPDRVKDVMEPAGCELTNYRLNPIFLADHNPKTPIATAAVEIKSDRVEAVVTFAPLGASAKADEYCALYKAGILNTVSPGFRELEASPLPGGGMHIKRWELLEISGVSVPAQPQAVVTARSLEMADVKNLKVGASRTLPVMKMAAFDAGSAGERILTNYGFNEDDPNSEKARKGFLVYNPAALDDRKSYGIPFADVIGGRLHVSAKSIAAASAALAAADLPSEVAAKAKAVLDHYEAQMKGAVKTKAAGAFKRKDMYDVSQLAYVVSQLVSLALSANWEREYEGDESELPELLADIARGAGEALVAMTEEETAEMLARLSDLLTGEQKAYVEATASPLLKTLSAARLTTKAGRAFSAANEKTLRDACKSILGGHDAVKAMLDDNSGTEPDDDEAGTDTGKAAPAMLTKQQRILEFKRRQVV